MGEFKIVFNEQVVKQRNSCYNSIYEHYGISWQEYNPVDLYN